MSDDTPAASRTPVDPAGEVARKQANKARKQADKQRKRRVELAGAIIIGTAAVLTAWATFRGAQLDGQVRDNNTAALRLTVLANDAFNQADAQEAIERDWIFNWIVEIENGQSAADYLEAAMPAEVFALADEWFNATDTIIDPFSEEAADAYDSYSGLPSVELLLVGDDLDIAANCAVFEAQVADAQGAAYGEATVFLAIALVVGGIAALLQRKAAQTIALATSIVSLLLGVWVLGTATDETGAREDKAPEFFVDEEGDLLPSNDAVAAADERCPS